jgi:hypothetical protein
MPSLEALLGGPPPGVQRRPMAAHWMTSLLLCPTHLADNCNFGTACHGIQRVVSNEGIRTLYSSSCYQAVYTVSQATVARWATTPHHEAWQANLW